MVNVRVGVDYHFNAPAALGKVAFKVSIAFFVVAAVNENDLPVSEVINPRVCKAVQIVCVFRTPDKLKHYCFHSFKNQTAEKRRPV